MAKTIKFNLILDDKPVRTIEDLRENFLIEDILESYNNGLLQRWLEVRGYSELLEKVNSIKAYSDIDKIQQLISIFEIEYDSDKIKEGIAILDYINERKRLLEEYDKSNYKVKSVIDNYHAGYDSIINDIIENKENMPKIKANIKEIEENYIGLFTMNYEEVYRKLINNAPLAIFAILMNKNMRKCFIPNNYSNMNSGSIYDEIIEMILNKDLIKTKLGKELKVFNGDTDSYWKDVEPKGKMYMIISMEYGSYVRNAGIPRGELSVDDINGKFMFLNGIDYKSYDIFDELLYMEV